MTYEIIKIPQYIESFLTKKKKKKSEKSYFKLGLKVKGLETGGIGKNGLKNFKESVVKKRRREAAEVKI
jgi:hypothetical protein